MLSSVFHSGRAALQAVLSFRPDVVLLDIGMPGMDGYEVARRIRANIANRSIMLIALTGWGQEEDRRRSAAAGFNHHLVKPADIEQLRQLLSGSKCRSSSQRRFDGSACPACPIGCPD